jgi:hypothetical protein
MNVGRREPADGVPTLVLPDDRHSEPVAVALGCLQELTFTHPVAMQAIFRAFVAEGRRFARTDEGRSWAERLARSDLVRQGRVAWDSLTLNAFDDREETVLPTAIVDAYTKAIASDDLHAVLASLLQNGLLEPGGDDDAR